MDKMLVALSVVTCVSSLATLGIVIVTVTRMQRELTVTKAKTNKALNKFKSALNDLSV